MIIRTKHTIIITTLLILTLFAHATLFTPSSNKITGQAVSSIYEQLFKEANITFIQTANITEQDAKTALTQAEAIKQELTTIKLPTKYIQDHIIEARKAFDGQNTTKLVEQIYSITNLTERKKFVDALNTTFTTEEIKQLLDKQTKIRYNYTKTNHYTRAIEQRKKLTYNVLDAISILDQKINDLKKTTFNLTDIITTRTLIQTKFEKEQLDELPALIDRTITRTEELQIEQTRLRTFIRASQQNITGFAKRHPLGITITLIILAIITFIAWNEISIIILQRKISDAKIEQNVIEELKKKTQQTYYQEGSTSKSMYDIKMQNYHDKELTTKQQLPVFEKNLHDAMRKRKYYLEIKRLFKKR